MHTTYLKGGGFDGFCVCVCVKHTSMATLVNQVPYHSLRHYVPAGMVKTVQQVQKALALSKIICGIVIQFLDTLCLYFLSAEGKTKRSHDYARPNLHCCNIKPNRAVTMALIYA